MGARPSRDLSWSSRRTLPWEHLPHDFPPYKTVYDDYAKWEADGTTRQVRDLLRDKTRRAHGRSAEPTAAVVDAQSVKTSANVAETSQGIDAGRKISGYRFMSWWLSLSGYRGDN
ncbi:transposase [Streptomyces pharetrae]|uniref:transposase n=1 Tax=Streptomyces pharetrae TaxID=291370 RepID=UPI003D9DC410